MDIARLLVSSKADVDKAKDDGATPLFMASQNGHVDIVIFLLQNKADIDKADFAGYTPLMIACERGHWDIVETLIEAGANSFQKNDLGDTLSDVAKTDQIKQMIINHPWYRRRALIMMRPHADHVTNVEHGMTSLGCLLTAKEREDAVLFHLKKMIASYL